MGSHTDSFFERHPISRRKFIQTTGVAVTVAATSSLVTTSPAHAAPNTPLPLLSDVTSAMPPTQSQAVCNSPGSLRVTWIDGSVPTGSVRTNVFVDGNFYTTSSNGSADIGGLNQGVAHTVELATLTSSNVESERTSTILRAVNTADNFGDGRPPWVTGVRGYGGIQLLWAHPGQYNNQYPAKYGVYATTSSTPLITVDGRSNSVWVPNLNPNTTYELLLVAQNSNGTPITEARNRLRVTPLARALWLDYTAPGVATSLVLTPLNGGLRVTWNAGADNQSGTMGYRIFLDAKYIGTQESGTSYVVGGLSNNRQYMVNVSVYDNCGNESSWSMSAFGTPNASGGAASAPAPRAAFTTRGAQIIDPNGTPFVPIGANVVGPSAFWYDGMVGLSAAASQNWRWTCVRVNVGWRDYTSPSGYIYFNNNQLDTMIAEYTGKKIVVMLAMFSHGSGQSGQLLPTGQGSSGDPSGRSMEQAATDWWVEIAKRYRDNPYVWFNLLNEPGDDMAGLDAQYRRMLNRIRSVAPRSVVVLDALGYASDIPVSSTIGTGTIRTEESFVLSKGPGLASIYGPPAGMGPLVHSVHFYGRWAVNWGPGGQIQDGQLAQRLRDYITRAKAASLPVMMGEVGVQPFDAIFDGQCTKIALYQQGTVNRNGSNVTTGVAVEQGIGVTAWHASPSSGMSVARPELSWWNATSIGQANPFPQAGNGLWAYTHP